MGKALVTGSSRGIGAAIARRLTADGWEVTINYLNSEAQALKLAQELGCNAVRADVAIPEQAAELVRLAGEPELLVCNAGIAWQGLIQDMEVEEWRRIFDVNIGGVFNCCRAAIPAMVRRKSGCIINMSSILALRGGSCEAAYSATKGAIVAFTRSLAKELGPSGIRVNAVAPGPVDTDMLSVFTAEDKLAMADAAALCRIALPDDIARAVSFLASPDAGFITGQILGVDGAMVM